MSHPVAGKRQVQWLKVIMSHTVDAPFTKQLHEQGSTMEIILTLQVLTPMNDQQLSIEIVNCCDCQAPIETVEHQQFSGRQVLERKPRQKFHKSRQLRALEAVILAGDGKCSQTKQFDFVVGD